MPASAPALIAELGCGGCHTSLNIPFKNTDHLAPLITVSTRRNPLALYRYLRNPFAGKTAGAIARMPDFYLSEAEAVALTNFLADRQAAAAPDFAELRNKYPQMNAARGERIYLALNCNACHSLTVSADNPMPGSVPDLSLEGLRVQRQWLEGYLRKPHVIRPHGIPAGAGNRMPDFRLTAEEAKILAEYLMNLKENRSGIIQPLSSTPLSTFSLKKAEALWEAKFSCSGCHRMDGRGGRIGPDLSDAAQRLQPAYIRAAIENPEGLFSHNNMPKIPLTNEERRLLLGLLQQSRQSENLSARMGYPDLGDSLLAEHQLPIASEPGAKTYRQLCAPCHGSNGAGNGFNAGNLPVIPTLHSNASYMERRPNDTLYDGVFAGGLILNRSHTMPAWGQTLSDKQIRDLVNYMRTLCNCNPPEWSQD